MYKKNIYISSISPPCTFNMYTFLFFANFSVKALATAMRWILTNSTWFAIFYFTALFRQHWGKLIKIHLVAWLRPWGVNVPFFLHVSSKQWLPAHAGWYWMIVTIPTHGPVETIWLPPISGDVPSNHFFDVVCSAPFRGDAAVETILGEPGVSYCRFCELTSLIWWHMSSISISHQMWWCMSHKTLLHLLCKQKLVGWCIVLKEHTRWCARCQICWLTSRTHSLTSINIKGAFHFNM